MSIEEHIVTDDPKPFIAKHFERMTPYIQSKLYSSALSLMDNMRKPGKFPIRMEEREHCVYFYCERDIIVGGGEKELILEEPKAALMEPGWNL